MKFLLESVAQGDSRALQSRSVFKPPTTAYMGLTKTNNTKKLNTQHDSDLKGYTQPLFCR